MISDFKLIILLLAFKLASGLIIIIILLVSFKLDCECF